MDEFDCRTKIISGTGTIGRLKELDAKRVFLVTDPYFYRNGWANRVAAASGAEQVEIFHEVQPDPTVELAAMAGWVHDVGNAVNRHNHGMNGAVMLLPLLRETGLPMNEVVTILGAVGNHEEQNGTPISPVSAALIIADKCDAHRSRVRRGQFNPADIHDVVNYAIKDNWVEADRDKGVIRLSMTMDETASVMDFMSIYMSRMLMCEKAAKFLGCRFEIVVNGFVVNRQ